MLTRRQLIQRGGIALVALLLALTATVRAQSTGNGFSAASGPCALHYASAWSVCNFTSTAYDIFDYGATKNNHLFLLNNDLIAPNALSFYSGGLGYQPNLAFLDKTNVTPGSFQIGLDATFGIATPAGGTAKFGSLLGGAATWNFTPNLTWNAAQAHWGIFNGTQFFEVSSQLQWAFNPSSASVAAAQARRLAKARALIDKAQGVAMVPSTQPRIYSTNGDCAEFADGVGTLRDSGHPCAVPENGKQ